MRRRFGRGRGGLDGSGFIALILMAIVALPIIGIYKIATGKDMASQLEINIRLHKGCEILCAAEYINEILYGVT